MGTRPLAPARQGEYELRIPHYQAAIPQDPYLPGIYLDLGLAYFKLKKLPEAASAFDRATQADPASFRARVLLGMSYYGTHRYDAAAADRHPWKGSATRPLAYSTFSTPLTMA